MKLGFLCILLRKIHNNLEIIRQKGETGTNAVILKTGPHAGLCVPAGFGPRPAHVTANFSQLAALRLLASLTVANIDDNEPLAEQLST